MVGLIWFVQLVHYPMMKDVGVDEFVRYEKIHQQRTTLVVAPLMLTELATALLLVFLSTSGPITSRTLAITGLILLTIIWASTYLLQVPMHEALGNGFNAAHHARLVVTNWIRTIAWTARGVVAILIAKQAWMDSVSSSLQP